MELSRLRTEDRALKSISGLAINGNSPPPKRWHPMLDYNAISE
jgi:hypothetical protein